MIHVVCGLPGAGKTHYRLNSPDLKDLPCFDMQTYYDQGMVWNEAMVCLVSDIENHPGEDIVVEGIFWKGSESRKWLEYTASYNDQKVRYIWINTPRKVCEERIMQTEPDRREIRLKLLDRYAEED